jgi:hypothetical protein
MREIAAYWWGKLAPRRRTNGADPAGALLREYRSEVAAAIAGTPDRDTLDALLARPPAPGPAGDDIELELEMLHGARDLLDLQERVTRDGLPFVAHQHKALAGEACHFAASVFLASDAAQRTGRLFLTSQRLVFVASPIVTLPWGAITRIVEDGRDLVVAAPGRGAVHRFRCNSFSDARCGGWLAERLRADRRA